MPEGDELVRTTILLLQAAGQSHLPKPLFTDKVRRKFRYKRVGVRDIEFESVLASSPRPSFIQGRSTGESAVPRLLKLVCKCLMASRSGTASTLVLATTSLMVASPPAVRSVPR